MRGFTSTRVRALTLFTCASALVAARAQANPLELARFGGLRGDPVYTGAFALYWNPAALAGPGWDVAADAALIARQASFDRDAALNNVPAEAQAANAGPAHATTVGVVPGVAGRWGRRLRTVALGVGLGVYASEGGAVSWDKNLRAPPQYPGAIDGPQRWASISSQLLVVDVAAGFGIRHLPSGLSFGVAPALSIARFSTTRASNLDRTDDLVDAAGNLKEGRALFQGAGLGWSLIVGARWDIGPRWAVAATYQRGARLRIAGDLQLAFGTQAPSVQSAYLKLPIADTVRVGASLRVSRRVTLRPSLEWAIWSFLHQHVFRAAADGTPLLVVERDYGDGVAGRLRADVQLTDRVRLLGSIGVEKSPTPTRTLEPGFGESDSVELGAGAQVALSGFVDLTASFVYQYFLPRTVTDSVQQPLENGAYTEQREYLLVNLEVHAWRAPSR